MAAHGNTGWFPSVAVRVDVHGKSQNIPRGRERSCARAWLYDLGSCCWCNAYYYRFGASSGGVQPESIYGPAGHLVPSSCATRAAGENVSKSTKDSRFSLAVPCPSSRCLYGKLTYSFLGGFEKET